MYESVARFIVLMALGFASAHVIEGLTWLFSVAIDRYHVSVAFRTVGVICAYVVFREFIRGIWQRGWQSLFDLL